MVRPICTFNNHGDATVASALASSESMADWLDKNVGFTDFQWERALPLAELRSYRPRRSKGEGFGFCPFAIARFYPACSRSSIALSSLRPCQSS